MSRNTRKFNFEITIFETKWNGKLLKDEQVKKFDLHIKGQATDNGIEEKDRYEYDARIFKWHRTSGNTILSIDITDEYLHAALVESIDLLEDIHPAIMNHIDTVFNHSELLQHH